MGHRNRSGKRKTSYRNTAGKSPRLRIRPSSAHRRRGTGLATGSRFDAPEVWHEPRNDGQLQFIVEEPCPGYMHPVTKEEVRDRIECLPEQFRKGVEYVHFSRMTRKRRLLTTTVTLLIAIAAAANAGGMCRPASGYSAPAARGRSRIL